MAKKTVLMLAAATLVTVSAATAAKPQPGSWRVSGQHRQQLVEQQTPGGATQPDPSLWVINPTLGALNEPWCLWDADDSKELTFNGDLDAGAAASVTVCVIADWSEKLSLVKVRDGDPGLEVTVSSSGRTVTGPNHACMVGPDYDHEGVVNQFPVEGSNGGVGVFTEITVTVENVGKRRLRSQVVDGYVGLRSGTFNPCPLGPWTGLDPAWQEGAG